MKKFIVWLIICIGIVSCNVEDKRVALIGRIVSIKEYDGNTDILVFKTDDGCAFEIEADDEPMDKYYYESKQHVSLHLLIDKDTTVMENIGIKAIK